MSLANNKLRKQFFNYKYLYLIFYSNIFILIILNLSTYEIYETFQSDLIQF